MTGFYLSLNQGVTVIKDKYKASAKNVLKITRDNFRAQIDLKHTTFNIHDIVLKTSNKSQSSLPLFYQEGNIISKYYSAFKLPNNEQLVSDIHEILRIYEMITYNHSIPSNAGEKEDDEENITDFEDLTKFRFHKRLERNSALSKKVKKLQGYTCKACGVNFELLYGELGKNYIEAHHLKPLSSLKGERIELDARTDFIVLCSNCHRMIHRYNDPSDISGFKALINQHFKS